MSLKFVHQIIIFAGIAVSLVFALWCFTDPSAAGQTGFLIAGLISILAALALVAYEIYFLRKTRRLILG